MTEHFKAISQEEFEKLRESIALITVLIAGADGKFEKKELNWAEKIAEIRSYKMSESLIGFYQEVGKDFSSKLEEYVDAFPNNVSDRNRIIAERLEGLNDILAKLSPKLGASMYKSLTSFAKHVAKASGGFWGFFTIGPEEEKLIGLPMITPIEYQEEEDEQ